MSHAGRRQSAIGGLGFVLGALLILAALGCFGRSSTGWCRDPEFAGEGRLVATWPPRWQWSFFSPVGDSDLALQDLDPERQREELAYRQVCLGTDGLDLFRPDWE